jgi:NAD(P)-dependent dehydrogenase (short-subunit alcohol dehydrogenase family)
MVMDRAVIVTGAASGIGRAVASLFAEAGDRLALIDVNMEALQEASKELGDGAELFDVDVSSSGDVASAIRDITSRLGRIDVLCNVAGVLDGYAPATETSDDLWQKTLSINLSGPFYTCRAAIPVMRDGGGGAIVNIASISSFVAGGGGAAYTASKHGVLGLTRQLAFDHGNEGIRVNAVCPGATRSGMTEYLFTEAGRNAHVDAAIAGTPAGRWADPKEIGRVVRWLASDEASFVHGAAYVADGGWTIA